MMHSPSLSSKASAAEFIVVAGVVVHPVVGSIASSTKTSVGLTSLRLRRPASPASLVMRGRGLCLLAQLLILHVLRLPLDLLRLRRHVLVHEHRGQQALLEESFRRGLLGGEKGAVHGLLVALGDLAAAPDQVLEDVRG